MILARATFDNTKYGAKQGEYYCESIDNKNYVFDSNPLFAKDVTGIPNIPAGFEYVQFSNDGRIL